MTENKRLVTAHKKCNGTEYKTNVIKQYVVEMARIDGTDTFYFDNERDRQCFIQEHSQPEWLGGPVLVSYELKEV